MVNDYMLIALGWIITIILLILFVPKHRIREAFVAFSIKQIITWAIGLLVVELRLLEYPVRLFPYACRSSFSFEYFIYPAFCAIFNLHYPETKSKLYRCWYYVLYTTSLTMVEVLVERYTDILHYIHWTWYITWITIFVTFYISRIVFVWFYKKERAFK